MGFTLLATSIERSPHKPHESALRAPSMNTSPLGFTHRATSKNLGLQGFKHKAAGLSMSPHGFTITGASMNYITG